MLRSRFCFCILCAILATALAMLMIGLTPTQAPAQPAKQPAGKPVSFINDVAPILKESCFGCHGAKNPKGKMYMTRYETFRKGGIKDDPIVNGKPEESHIIDLVTATGKG